MRNIIALLTMALLIVMVAPIGAQDMMEPGVMVSDQVSTNGKVVIDMVMSDGPGWIVIHVDNGEGRPGPVAGYRAVNDGASYNVTVSIDASIATPTLFAMLHTDTGEVGVYEFGTVEGADGPVRDSSDNVITPSFGAEIIRAYDQFVADGTVTIASVVTAQDGWMVIHSAGESGPGPVIGSAAVSAGTNADVVVTLDGDATDVLFPMLHVDTGEAGVYEFGQVEGADGPVAINGRVAVLPITVGYPAMRVPAQVVSNTVVAESVLSEGPGWLVIHQDNGEGRPGPVIGSAAVADGTNMNVAVEVDPAGVTPVLFPMLHVDTGTVGEYEFGTVDGADGPAQANGSVLVMPVNAAPSIEYSGSLDGNTVTIASALIDMQGWMVIHADNGEGRPGPVLGATPIVAGHNANIAVTLEGDITATLFPMLHYDTGEMGVYEFGQVEGADGPVVVNGAPVTGPMTP